MGWLAPDRPDAPARAVERDADLVDALVAGIADGSSAARVAERFVSAWSYDDLALDPADPRHAVRQRLVEALGRTR